MKLTVWMVGAIVAISGAGSVARGSGEPGGSSPGLADLIREELRVERFRLLALHLPDEEFPITFDVAVTCDGVRSVLKLRRTSVRGPTYRVLVQWADRALAKLPAPPTRTYRGSVEGEPASVVAASLLSDGLYADILRLDTRGWAVRPLKLLDPDAPRDTHVVYSQADVRPMESGGDALLPPSDSTARLLAKGAGGGADGRKDHAEGACTVTVADIGFDADYDWFVREGSADFTTCVAIIENGLNITNVIYARDVEIVHQISRIVLRTNPDIDPYGRFSDGSNFGDMLSAFRWEWESNMTAFPHDLAYYLTGKANPEYAGLAWVGAVCTKWQYGMGIRGWGYEDFFRHEIGHIWGAVHECGGERGSIMCGNYIPVISDHNIRVISAHRDSRWCLERISYDGGEPGPPYTAERPDPIMVVQGQGPVVIDVLEPYTDRNCDPLRINSHDALSAFGAAITVLDPCEPGRRDSLLYAPRSDFVGKDHVGFSVADGTGFVTPGVAVVEVMPRACICYLKLDALEGVGAIDASGYGNGGFLQGTLTFDINAGPGRHGGALHLEGVAGDHVSLGTSAVFDCRYEVTVAAWFRVEAFSRGGESIIAKGSNAYRLGRGEDAALAFTCTGLTVAGSAAGTIQGNVPVNDGAWHHAAGVYDGSRIYLYIDGVLDRSLPASGIINRTANAVTIGGNQWNGAIDEVRIYNHGLRAEEIQALYRDSRVENAKPADGTSGVLPGSPLAWLAAASATAHDVYFGTDRAAVALATRDSPEFIGRQPETSFVPEIRADVTYSWRIDEVAGAEIPKGAVRSFTSSFAFTDFDEPPLRAGSYSPGLAAAELGFQTAATPRGGQYPFAGVIGTSSTLTTPIFVHRSVSATTTFDPVDCAGRSGVVLSLMLQAGDGEYEAGDRLEVFVSDGEDRIDLVTLNDAGVLAQRAGMGYGIYAGRIPDAWTRASMIISSSSTSSQVSDRYDFDQIRFFSHSPSRVIASTYFDEPAAGTVSYASGPGDTELGFETTSTATGGAEPIVGVVEAGADLRTRFLTHRSVDATTAFSAVDVRGWKAVRVTVVLRVRPAAYEPDDALDVYVTNGSQSVQLVSLDGGTGLSHLADGHYVSVGATVPDAWNEAILIVSTASDSADGSEGYDVSAVEFVSREGPPAYPVFRRGDANGDGAVNIADSVFTLQFLFLSGASIRCSDAADVTDDEIVNISDAVYSLRSLFTSDIVILAPSPACGPDTTGSGPDRRGPQRIGCEDYCPGACAAVPEPCQ